MATADAFLPSNISTVLLSVGAAAVAIRLPQSSAGAGEPWRSGGEFLEVKNRGTTNVYIETSPGGDPGGVATPSVVAVVAVAGGAVGSYPLGPGEVKVIRRAPGDSHLSAIGDAAGPSVISIALGNGI